jgi:hypothetical protein
MTQSTKRHPAFVFRLATHRRKTMNKLRTEKITLTASSEVVITDGMRVAMVVIVRVHDFDTREIRHVQKPWLLLSQYKKADYGCTAPRVYMVGLSCQVV